MINHEVFGEIEFDLHWHRKIDITIFGVEKNVILSIDGTEEGDFTNDQFDAYLNFINEKDRFISVAEDEMYSYYQSVCTEYRERFGAGQANVLAPIIFEKSQLEDLVSLTHVVIRMFPRNRRTVGLLFDSK
ncbi:hypothetical protein QFZ81_005335 [Paenibacillus sp. V4I9]|uniref:DUF6985 domain-containing protein n=1 Tax=Paenibacillus sp. V4I9 TaxID=3042308 RepID=UPI0027894202|nr:hypothetical protein [Paenibacillus sp. V4I9]MDQ0890247.1 hypothetical protein [Paenibacillus sp. V4I9]